MARGDGIRKARGTAKGRAPELGNYIIVTDAKGTEPNYLNGLRDTIPDALRRRLVIKVTDANTKYLVKTARELSSKEPQFGQLWLVLDRDNVKDFDKLIREANASGVKVGWSNPCIEIWFLAYFGEMAFFQSSRECLDSLKVRFKKATGKEYTKTDRSILSTLREYGDEGAAISLKGIIEMG